MKKVKFSYYEGNITFKESLGDVSLDYFIKAIKNPNPKFKALFEEIKKATNSGDTKLKRKLKQGLYSFTPSVIIPYSKSRSYFYIKSFTGLMQIDFDGIESIAKAQVIKVNVFSENKEIVCSFLSPSRKGVKCLMRTETPKNIEHYKAMHKSMISKFSKYGNYLDDSTKNAVLPMFLSYDENILSRKFENAKEWVETDYSKPVYVNLNNTPTTSIQTPENKSKNYEKVVNLLKEKFERIVNNGHPQVVSASLVLGSRVGAGYIDKNEALGLIEQLINSNSYLVKNTKGYLSTAKWCINQGELSPKYF